MEFKSILPTEVKVAELHSYLLAGISPRPIAFASTVDENGNPNLSPYSFFNVFSSNPPIAIVSPARRVRDNTIKHTLENVLQVKEIVINVVSYEMVEQMSLSSTEYPKGINEFVKAGFTMLNSDLVRPFRVAESPMQLECRVNEVIHLGNEGGAGNLIVCEILKVHINKRVLDEDGKIDQHKIDVVGRLGADWYVRASGNALFEVEKPLRSMGIGVDAIPDDIRNSNILSGNDLGKLGNVDQLPDETEVNEYKLLVLADIFQEQEDNPKALEIALHQIAKEQLSHNRVWEAWKTLLSFNNG